MKLPKPMVKSGKKIVAVIPARGGSKGLPGKNIKLLADEPLISYSIKAALDSEWIDRVIFSTDDDKIAEIAEQYGAEVLFKRPKELSTDMANTPPVIEHAIGYLEEKEKYFPDVVVTLQPTSPLRRSDQIDEALRKFIASEFDSLISVKKAFPPWWLFKRKNDHLVPFIELEGGRNPLLMERQEFEDVYQPNGAIYITNRYFLKENNLLISADNGGFFLMDEMSSLDIDTEIDFLVVEKVIDT